MASIPANGSAKPSIDPKDASSRNPSRSSTPRNNSYGQNANAKRNGQNVNHLLSFTLPPRSRPPAPTLRRSKKGGGGTPFNKERYINAQYRFLVKPTGDYTAYFADSDIYLHWADILQIIIPTTSTLSGASASVLSISDQPHQSSHEGAACPICLSPPTAPRMTKCGHVYCYPCILRYLTLVADGNAAGGSTGNAPSQKWRRCPICWDAVYARDLKAVRWWDPRALAQEHESLIREQRDLEEAKRASQGEGSSSNGDNEADHRSQPAASGEVLSMRLIERPHLTTLALPQSSSWPSSNLDHALIAPHSAPWHFQPDVMGFAKFMLACPDLLIESLTSDLLELEEEIKTLKGFGSDALGLQFVDLAEQKVREQIQKVQTELDTPFVRSTIGQVKNDMKDHEAAEAGKASRLGDHLSRRQRKKLERGLTYDTIVPVAEAAPAVAEDDAVGQAEEAPGTEEFLALRSHGVGSMQPPQQSGPESAAGALTDSSLSGSPRTSKAAKPRKNLNPPAPSSSTYLFFQAASGQNIFLHPLDIKVLLTHYGSYAALPRDLSVKVQGADEGSMNEELRRRCKYLNHIPMAADVVFIEVDWESMTLVSKASLKPYEQALRQRKGKRRDKARREDRAKTKAEEAEMISRPGGAAAAAVHRQRKSATPFDDKINFPSDGLSRSYGSNGLASGHDDGAASNLSVSPGFSSASPSFREAALWGAEREFPIHPGAAGVEDFPDSLGSALRGVQPSGSESETRSSVEGQAPASRSKKTVWGTPAARSSFSNALHGSKDAHGIWDDDMDDAWHELEEDFILGSTGSGRRPSGSVKEGRGLNRQTQAQTPKSGSQTPKSGVQGESNASGTSTPADGKGKRQKKKLILTGGGGRGAW